MDLLPLASATAEQRIRAIRRRVTYQEAVEAFAHGLVGAARCLARGPLRSVADVYVPFQLYQVTVSHGARREALVLGLDAVGGILDLYRFDRIPEAIDLVDVWTRNHLEPVLSTTAAHEVLAARVKRMTYQRVGFLAVGRVHVDVQPIDVRLHVPYWAGFFGRRDAASLVVMDAVRRQFEGAKVRRLITAWLAA